MSYSCVKIVIVLKLIILLTVIGLVTSEVKLVSSVEHLRACWSSSNSTCVRAVIFDNLKNIWQKKEIRITDSISIEKISNLSPEDYGTVPVESTEEGRRYRGDADQILENVGKFLKTHALRVDLWQFGALRIQRSQENPGSLEIIFDMSRATPNSNGEAKDTKMWKVVVPLIMGFKSTGALILGITTVKMFLLKALAISNMALLAAGFLVAKKVLSSVGTQHHEHLLRQNPVPYYHDHNLEGGYPSAYGYSNYIAPSGYYGAPTGHGYYGYGPTSSGTLADAEGEDLQAHFSTKVETNTKTNTTNHTAAKKKGTHRNVYIPLKSGLHRIPAMAYRKLVNRERRP